MTANTFQAILLALFLLMLAAACLLPATLRNKPELSSPKVEVLTCTKMGDGDGPHLRDYLICEAK